MRKQKARVEAIEYERLKEEDNRRRNAEKADMKRRQEVNKEKKEKQDYYRLKAKFEGKSS